MSQKYRQCCFSDLESITKYRENTMVITQTQQLKNKVCIPSGEKGLSHTFNEDIV